MSIRFSVTMDLVFSARPFSISHISVYSSHVVGIFLYMFQGLPNWCSNRPDILRMSELSDSSELQRYSSAVLYVLSAVTPPREYVEIILETLVTSIKSSTVGWFVYSILWCWLLYDSHGEFVYMHFLSWSYSSIETFCPFLRIVSWKWPMSWSSAWGTRMSRLEKWPRNPFLESSGAHNARRSCP
jgi:hypothetical protein